jgi:predicted PurR-regulated permease PerM
MRSLVVLVCLVVLLAAVKAASSVVVPVLLASTLAIAFQPVAEWLSRRGLPAVVSALVTLVAVLGIIGGGATLLWMAAQDFAGSLPHHEATIAHHKAALVTWLRSHGLEQAAADTAHSNPSATLSRLAQEGLVGASSALQSLFLVLLITVFIQLEAATYRRKLVKVLGSPHPVRKTLQGFKEVQRYLAVKMLLSLANGVLLGTWCWAWGLPNPLLWGVLAFVLNFIPIIGSILAAVPPVALALVEQGPGGAAAVAGGYVLVNLLVDNMVEPRVMGRALGLSPLVVLASMLVWGFVLGPVGAILAVPLTMAVKIMLEQSHDLRWIALMISDAGEIRTVTATMPPVKEGAPTAPTP